MNLLTVKVGVKLKKVGFAPEMHNFSLEGSAGLPGKLLKSTLKHSDFSMKRSKSYNLKS